MALYRYRCQTCGHECDTLKDRCSSDNDTQKCVKCLGIMVRVMSGVSAHYRGNGFYSTDYRKDGK